MSINGAEVIAQALKQLDIKHIFGIVGIPVIEVAEACVSAGIQFISFRNEQSAVYAASIYGYLTGRPGVCLVVGGPGVVNALAGIENANKNRFPLLLLAGSSETNLKGLGAFQQLDQVEIVRSMGAKFSEQPPSLATLPRLLKQAYTVCFYGKPGSSYIDLPANLIQATSTSKLPELTCPLAPPRSLGDPQSIAAAALALKQASFPLLIVGKGCAYARAENSIRTLQQNTNIAFIPTPMGKGVISDYNRVNLSAARSLALQSADVVLVLGARLNWILHFGAAPKFRANVKVLQIDIVPEELHQADIGICGDVGLVAEQLTAELKGWTSPKVPPKIIQKRTSNGGKAAQMEKPQSKPGNLLQYNEVYKVIRETVRDKCRVPVIYVSEGANTMDISRSSFPLAKPRSRLDAGTNATMGIGMGYAICAKVAQPDSMVIAIEGDSAFGFSAIEVETAVRNGLSMIIYVMNNSGVYHGADPALYGTKQALPTTALSLNTQYHTLATSLGALGYEAKTLEDLKLATIDAIEQGKVAVINVIIDPGTEKKLEFGWMASSKM